MASVYYPNCERARERLVAHKTTPCSQHLPRGPIPYFPRSRVVKVLEEFPVGDIFTCSCAKCVHHADLGGKVDVRHMGVDEKELLGPYATIYGLLIYLRYPFLISLFLQNSTNLENGYLSKDSLGFLKQSRTLNTGQVEIYIDEIVEGQYRFRVRRFLSRKTVTIIDEAEILPIEEDSKRVGRGDFGEVYAFDCPLEYMDETLQLKQINRFARKIFNKRWCQSDTVDEWVAHLHANDLQHPNLMEAFSASHHGTYFFIVFELAQCTLWDFLKGGSQVEYPSQELWTQIHGLASGLAYLHGQKVKGGKQKNGTLYHQDLKPSNILIINKVMKIADFGLSDYKPYPRMSDSNLVGDSKHEGAKVYAPPSRAGPLSDKYDIYSLGTILSEIASYDVGKETQVERYRENRRKDGKESEGSMQFYDPTTFELKPSVRVEHSNILEAAEKSKDFDLEATLDRRWQKNFYQKSLFDLIAQMLHVKESIRPSATEVVTKLKSRIHEASRALRGSEPYNIDIWDSTVKGTVPVNAEAPDKAMDCRLRAFINNEHCGLWLYPDDHDLSVKIRRFVFDRGIEQTVEHVYRKGRKPFMSVLPSYIDSVGEYELRLIHAKDEPPIRYVFPTQHEALRFQGLMTGQHAYKSMSIGLRQFTFLKKKTKKTKLTSYVTGKFTYELVEQSNVVLPTQLQLWTNGGTEPEMRRGEATLAALEVKIAILTTSDLASHLYLVDVTNQIGISEESLAQETDTNMIRLTHVKVSQLNISQGIPLNLFLKTHRYKNNGDSLFEEAKHDEIRLYAKEASDVKMFWDTMAALCKLLPASGPLGHIQPTPIS